MKFKTTLLCILSCSISLLTGCGIGKNSVLFISKTNAGVDVDAKQLTGQIDINRQELVIGPTFEGGQVLPVVAGFQEDNKVFAGFGVSSLFSGGDAALAWTMDNCSIDNTGKSDAEGRTNINLTKPVEGLHDIPGPGNTKPFIYGTDSVLGLQLGWTGATPVIPDEVKIGFNRVDIARAPILATSISDKLQVNMPSFLGALVTESSFKGMSDTTFSWIQMLATGKSAINLACSSRIKHDLLYKFGEQVAPADFKFTTSAKSVTLSKDNKVDLVVTLDNLGKDEQVIVTINARDSNSIPVETTIGTINSSPVAPTIITSYPPNKFSVTAPINGSQITIPLTFTQSVSTITATAKGFKVGESTGNISETITATAAGN